MIHIDTPMALMEDVLGRTRQAILKKINRLGIPRPWGYCKKLNKDSARWDDQKTHYETILYHTFAFHKRLLKLSNVEQIVSYLEENMIGVTAEKASGTKTQVLREQFPGRRNKARDAWLKRDQLCDFLKERQHDTHLVRDPLLKQHGYDYTVNGKPRRISEILMLANELAMQEGRGKVYLTDVTYC